MDIGEYERLGETLYVQSWQQKEPNISASNDLLQGNKWVLFEKLYHGGTKDYSQRRYTVEGS